LLGFGDFDGDGVERGVYVPSVPDARITRLTASSRPARRLRS